MADFCRNRWPDYVGISGRLASDYAADRKSRFAKRLGRRPEGIHAAPYEVGEIGPELFPHACLMGLEGMVSKHMERGYSVGRCTHWRKMKNPNHPAYRRVQDQFVWSKKNRS